jgi:hypothetical protein
MQSGTQSATPSFSVVHRDAVIRVYDEAGNVLEPHEHKGDFSFGFPFIRHQVFLPVVKRHPF